MANEKQDTDRKGGGKPEGVAASGPVGAYRCKEPIRCDGQRHEVGATISLNSAAAAPLLAMGHIAPLAPAQAAGDRN